MRQLLVVSLIGLALAAAPIEAQAFGRMAHRVICQAAYDQLSPAKGRIVDRLVRSLPEDHRALINEFQRRDADADVGFAESCVWADAVRRQPGYEGTQTWHYVNVARDARAVAASDCMAGCILGALDLHVEVLATEKDPWRRLQALMFVGHWVGDLHQPMHVSFGDDRGGNSVVISGYGDDCANLHRAFDYCIFEREAMSDGELLRLLPRVEATSAVSWSLDTALAWANDSLALTRDPTLRYCRQAGDQCLGHGDTVLHLDEAYHRRVLPVLTRQASMAAARLATLLAQRL